MCVTSHASPFIAEEEHAQRDWAPTCWPRDIKNIVLGTSNICCQNNPLAPWRPRSVYPWCTGEASVGIEDEYSAPLSTGILFTSRPSRRAVCWMTMTPPASGWDGTHLMLRGHVARQRSGRRRVFFLINAGIARLFVRVGPVAYVMGHKQRVSSWAGSGGEARTRVSVGPLHTPGSFSLQDPAGVRTYPKAPDSCVGVRCPYVGVRPYWGVVFFPATWRPLACPSSGVRRGPPRGKGTSHGCDASCSMRGYPWFRVPTNAYNTCCMRFLCV
jgi:hypothetical protein